jgi:hypothetical protein
MLQQYLNGQCRKEQYLITPHNAFFTQRPLGLTRFHLARGVYVLPDHTSSADFIITAKKRNKRYRTPHGGDKRESLIDAFLPTIGDYSHFLTSSVSYGRIFSMERIVPAEAPYEIHFRVQLPERAETEEGLNEAVRAKAAKMALCEVNDIKYVLLS